MVGLNALLGSFLRSSLLRQRLNQVKHDVLIGCGGLFYGFYLALSNCSPLILFIWGSDVLVAPRFLPFRFMAEYSLRKADAVVVDSDVQENACIALGCAPEKIVKFPWVNLQPIISDAENNPNCKRNAEILKSEFGWSSEDSVVISTRHHEPVYNMECLMQAIPLVIRKVPRARFLILGKGSLTEKLKGNATTMGVNSNVRFFGQVPFDTMKKYLGMADIYVSTSLSDGTSASLIEAMACKLPAVVTDIPGNREWVNDGINGLLFPVKDSNALADKITRLLEDEKLRRNLASKAYETVSEKADWQRNSKLLDRLVTSMVTLK